jgi:hypothetical protein
MLQSRYKAMTKPDIWYVAFVSEKDAEISDQAPHATRTFKSEIDAKLFAVQILAKGWTASAGTLGPYQPKQEIPASQMERWAGPGVGG